MIIKKFKLQILLVFILTFSIIIKVNGQEDKFTVDGYSLNHKLGLYLSEESDGFAGGAEINILANKTIYSVEFYRCNESVIFGPTPSEYFNHFGIMIGKFKGDKVFRVQYQAGLGSFWGLKRTDIIEEGSGLFSSDKYDSDDFFTVGLIGKLGFKIFPLPFFSIGLDLHANVNIEKPALMPMVSIEIGILRDKLNEPQL